MGSTTEQASSPQNLPDTLPSQLDFPVVGIGASAGGLQALRRFFEHMPADNGMAFVVILHLSPRHESNADKILQRKTRMPVLQVTESVAIEQNHVYVISPTRNLTMYDGHLRVSDAAPLHGRHIAIDLFFRTLADVHKERAYCIVLTGTGTDGSVGLARIKEQGGLTLAQAPEDAEYEDMPRSAIATGQVDLVLPVVEMPQKLLELWRNAQVIWLPQDMVELVKVKPPINPDQAQAAEQALSAIIDLLHSRTRHDFSHYKRATMLRRIERRMQVNAVADLPAYQAFLETHPEETPDLLSDMLIGVTNFFRDREAFEALEREVLPKLFSNGGTSDQEIRVWSAGCSTGEEPYSLAMLLSEQAELCERPSKLQVFATDINEQAIAIGRAGLYPHAIVTDVTPRHLRQFFSKEQTHYRIKKELREKVLFAVHSLLRDPPFCKLNLIVCRNLLIYLDRDVQREILRIFHFALCPGGYLFLGSSESADACPELFSAVDKKNRLYRATPAHSQLRKAPSVPIEGFQSLAPVVLEKAVRVQGTPLAEVHQRVLEQYAPPSVIVNRDAQIVHLSERAGEFLRYAGGEPSHNLLTLVHPKLRLELRTALFQASHSGRSVEARRVQLNRDGTSVYINMVVRPFRDAQTDLLLVLFDEVEDSLGSEGKDLTNAEQNPAMQHLEQELQYTKQQLQDTIEQAETSTQELKASNEELQAINEELRSITEELETSKEEFESINEELITVNHELKARVEETGKVNEDLQNLITATDIATVFVDRTLRIKWFTPRAAEIFNIRPTDAGRSLLDITHRLLYDDLATDVRRTLELLCTVEHEVQSRDGRWYIARLVPYRTTDESVEGAGLTFIDISRRREAEIRLRASQELMRLVAQSTEDFAILTLNPEGLITSWNRGAERMFGYSEAEALGQSSALIFVPEDRENGAPQAELRRAQEEGRAEDERWHQRKDGSRFYCSGVVTPLRNAVPEGSAAGASDASTQGFAKIARDLTQRKHLEVAQENRLEQTQAANQLKDEFFAVMSHELKHPLNLIQLNAELLARLPVVVGAPVANRATRSIVASVRSQARVIDDLLDLSRLRTGKLKLNRAPIDLKKVLAAFVGVLQAEAEASQLTVHLRVPEGDEPLVVDADAIRIEQIIWNLLSNAIKFTEAGGEVSMTLSHEAEHGMARLDMADTGQGIDPAALPIVFDMFGQAGTQHSPRHKSGLGIGLALVRQLAEAHDGRVQAQSPGLGQGSIFSVWLPLYELPYAETQDDDPLQLGKLRHLRVLLVDDSVDVLEILRMLLEMEGAQVTSAASGAEALDVVQNTDFDLILSDIGMPVMDGYQLMSSLRQLPRFTQTPAIALTGYGTAQDTQKALAAGFTRHLSKPVTLEALIEAIDQLDLGAS